MSFELLQRRVLRLERQNIALANPTWIVPTLTHSWVDFDPTLFTTTAYYKDLTGRVYIKGLVKSGTVGGATPIFTLPTGYRPPKHHIFPALSADALGQVRVQFDGTVVALLPSVNTWVSLDGISFLVT